MTSALRKVWGLANFGIRKGACVDFGIDKVEGNHKQTSYAHGHSRDASAAVIRLSPRARRALIEQRSPITREGRGIAGRLRIGLSNHGWVGRDFPSP